MDFLENYEGLIDYTRAEFIVLILIDLIFIFNLLTNCNDFLFSIKNKI